MMSVCGASCSVFSILSVTCSAICCALAPGQNACTTIARKVNGGSSSWPSWKYDTKPSSFGATDTHGLLLDRHVGAIDHPHRRLALDLKHRCQWHLDQPSHARQLHLDARALAEPHVGTADVGLDDERARRRVSRGGDLAHR